MRDRERLLIKLIPTPEMNAETMEMMIKKFNRQGKKKFGEIGKTSLFNMLRRFGERGWLENIVVYAPPQKNIKGKGLRHHEYRLTDKGHTQLKMLLNKEAGVKNQTDEVGDMELEKEASEQPQEIEEQPQELE